MSLNFTSAAGDFCFATDAWYGVLDWAEQYGWQPTLTEPPEHLTLDEWRELDKQYHARSYKTIAGQFVNADDANRLADALERLLTDMQDKEPPANHRYGFMLSPSRKEHIQSFIEYCRQGGFRI
jgi:hypothetical protein